MIRPMRLSWVGCLTVLCGLGACTLDNPAFGDETDTEGTGTSSDTLTSRGADSDEGSDTRSSASDGQTSSDTAGTSGTSGSDTTAVHCDGGLVCFEPPDGWSGPVELRTGFDNAEVDCHDGDSELEILGSTQGANLACGCGLQEPECAVTVEVWPLSTECDGGAGGAYQVPDAVAGTCLDLQELAGGSLPGSFTIEISGSMACVVEDQPAFKALARVCRPSTAQSCDAQGRCVDPNTSVCVYKEGIDDCPDEQFHRNVYYRGLTPCSCTQDTVETTCEVPLYGFGGGNPCEDSGPELDANEVCHSGETVQQVGLGEAVMGAPPRDACTSTVDEAEPKNPVTVCCK